MAGLGNPLAFGLGGGPSPQEAAYEALKSAVGVGNSAPGQMLDTIIESWRIARARGLAAAMDDDRAAAQITPEFATDLIPVYEDLLATYFATATPDQTRRDELTAQYIRQLSAAHVPLETSIQAINPGASLQLIDREETRDTQFGRVFEDYDPANPLASGPAFDINLVVSSGSGAKVTSFPNFSSDFIVLVDSPTLGPAIEQVDILNINLIGKLLNEVLPSWVDFRIFVNCGFILDQDPLDATVFCE